MQRQSWSHKVLGDVRDEAAQDQPDCTTPSGPGSGVVLQIEPFCNLKTWAASDPEQEGAGRPYSMLDAHALGFNTPPIAIKFKDEFNKASV